MRQCQIANCVNPVPNSDAYIDMLVTTEAHRDLYGSGPILIWSERDVLRLGAAKGPEEVADLLAEAARADEGVLMKEPPLGAGKYRALTSWLGSQVHDRVDATFAQIEEILGFRLPSSARAHRPYWAAGQPGGLGRAIADAGWRTRNVNMTAERVTFERARS